MNLANKLTIIRMILVPIYAVIFLYTDWSILALALFVIAALTDLADGYIARQYSMITTLGKFIDPLADKLLTLTAFVLFTYFGLINPLLVIIIIARELIISVFRAVAASKQVVIAAGNYGKLKTVLQISAIVMIHLYVIMGRSPDIIYWLVVAAMVAMTVISGADYIYRNRQVLDEEQ